MAYSFPPKPEGKSCWINAFQLPQGFRRRGVSKAFAAGVSQRRAFVTCDDPFFWRKIDSKQLLTAKSAFLNSQQGVDGCKFGASQVPLKGHNFQNGIHVGIPGKPINTEYIQLMGSDVSTVQVIGLCCANVPSASLAGFYSESLTKSWIETRGCAEFSLHTWIPIDTVLGLWMGVRCTGISSCFIFSRSLDEQIQICPFQQLPPPNNALVVALREKLREKVAITFNNAKNHQRSTTHPGRVSEPGCLASTFFFCCCPGFGQQQVYTNWFCGARNLIKCDVEMSQGWCNSIVIFI